MKWAQHRAAMLLGAGDDDGMKMAGEQLQACSQLSGSPMRTQPQAKRTTSGEALHLPLAPLQNSGYGLKSLKGILQQKHLVHRLLSRPSICTRRAADPDISSKGALR